MGSYRNFSRQQYYCNCFGSTLANTYSTQYKCTLTILDPIGWQVNEFIKVRTAFIIINRCFEGTLANLRLTQYKCTLTILDSIGWQVNGFIQELQLFLYNNIIAIALEVLKTIHTQRSTNAPLPFWTLSNYR